MFVPALTMYEVMFFWGTMKIFVLFVVPLVRFEGFIGIYKGKYQYEQEVIVLNL